MLTNHGLILYNGAISNDGTYYDQDEHLPDVNHKKDGALRAYKRLCAKEILTDFPIYFGKFGEIDDINCVWDAVNDTLKGPPGFEFKKKYDFQIHAIINMCTYGVMYYNDKKSNNLWDGYLRINDKAGEPLVFELVR